jgi:hypothetical protein
MTALLGVCASSRREARAAPGEVRVAKTVAKKVYAHLMPWFEDPSTSGDGKWGLHWTMANQDPNVVDGSGHRQIASYYYPAIGPYGSSDPDVIEYQLLLMKYAGIDGALIDWPGTIQTSDYPKNRQNAEAFIGKTAKFGLEFGIVYEDHNVQLAFDAGVIGDKIAAGTNDMAYVRDNYFTKPNYAAVNGVPLLMVFGPQTFTSPSDWGSLLSVFATKPTFLTLWYQSDQAGANAQGEFAWIYKDFMTGLQNFYDNRPMNVKFGVGYPGFNTFYAAGGWGAGPGWGLPYDGTGTFSGTLQTAVSSDAGYVQLATWNDYGEGTMIEPTCEFGYGFLTTLQQSLGVGYSQTELQLVDTLYRQRKQFAGNASVQAQLDQASGDLASFQVAAATSILEGTGAGNSTSCAGSSSGASGNSSSSSGSTSGSSGGAGTSSGTSSGGGAGSSGETGSSGGSSGAASSAGGGSASGGGSGTASSGATSSTGGGAGTSGGRAPDAGASQGNGEGASWSLDGDGGCGCRTAGTRNEAGSLAAGGGVVLLGWRALRRRARRRPL